MRHTTLLITLFLSALASLMLALAVGSMPLGPGDVLAALQGEPSLAGEVVRNLRLPRALGTFACGGLLALSGALIQVLLRNPLGDPYVLGISGGASIGALLAMLAGAALWLVNLSAFAGSFAVMLLVFALAHGEGSWGAARLLLTGVMVAAGCGAVVSLLLAIAPPQSLPGMLFWLMGDAAHIESPTLPMLLLATGLLLTLPLARDLNLLARGDVTATALGVQTGRLRWQVYALSAMFAAGAVASIGSVGFIGLLVPHLLRQLAGNDQRILLPACALGGGALLTVADTLARTLFAPQQLPVGVLTALIGVPLFLVLMSRPTGTRTC